MTTAIIVPARLDRTPAADHQPVEQWRGALRYRDKLPQHGLCKIRHIQGCIVYDPGLYGLNTAYVANPVGQMFA